MNAPRVSVGLPVYNGERWLPMTFDTILNQSFEDFELVITDNASVDRTESVCRDYMRRDARIRYIRNPKNMGVYNNFNLAFQHSRGEYFRWNASADLCHPRLIEECVHALDAHPEAVLVYPRTRIFSDDPDDGHDYPCTLNVVQDSPYERARHVIERAGLNNAQFGLIRAATLRKTRLNPSHLDGDMVLLMELSLYGKFIAMGETLFCRRERPETATKLQDRSSIMRYIDPDFGSPNFQLWKIYWSKYAAVHRASSLTMRDRWRLYVYFLRSMVWERAELRADIVMALR